MRSFLPDFIDTLSSRRQARVGALLNDARVAKEQLDHLAAAMFDQYGAFAPLMMAKEGVQGRTDASRVSINFRDVAVRMHDLFAVCNITSLLLDSHKAVLSSDVKIIEDELIALEKLAANYAFLLGDGKAYGYAYLEPFSDERGRDVSLPTIPDRAGSSFAGAEQATILADQGVLVLPEQTSSHGLTGAVLKGNAASLMTEETAFENLYTAGASTGWTAVVHAPGPVTNGLPEAGGRRGAQVLLEFYLSQPAPASQIRLTPVSNQPLELVQVTVYPGDDDSAGVPLLQEVRSLDRTHTLYFPMRTVARFRVLLNQPTYDRKVREANTTEDETRRLLFEARRQRGRVGTAVIRESIQTQASRSRRQRLAQIVRQFDDDRLDDRSARTAIPNGDGPNGVFRSDYLLRVLQQRSGEARSWAVSTPFSVTIQGMLLKILPEINELMLRGWRERQSSNPDPMTPDVFTSLPVACQPLVPTGYEYRYQLGLSSVSIGVDAPGYKGVFVSKPLDSPGDIGAMRLKVAEQNYYLSETERAQPKLTSVEYSVSNRTRPVSESDWIPILPIGPKTVIGERFFPDISGRGYFRFPASPLGTLRLCRNGYEVRLGPESYIRGPARGQFVGLLLVNGSYSQDDIFTVDYVPEGDPTVVSFESNFDSQIPLVATFDEEGAGEGYVTTVGRNEIDLGHTPYVDPKRVADSAYGPTMGLFPYQPVLVQLNTGAVAINLTSYGAGAQAPLPPADEGYYYLHAGRVLSFNRKVENFRVFYQYLQNSTRFRAVLRVNDKNFVSPVVDFVHAKAKIRRSDLGSV